MRSEGSPSPNGGACAVCGGAAVLYCTADAAALCVLCDTAVHAANPLASRHERVPLAAAMAAASGVYDLFAPDDDGASSWPTPAHGQGSPNSNSSGFTGDSGAEMSLFDLLSGPGVDLMAGSAALSDGAAPLWLQPGLDSGSSAWSPAAQAVVVPTAVAAAAAERRERVRRYREKRKNRKFQKTIRYESRKAYAEARPRIKGRFVKRAAAASNDDSADGNEGGKLWLSFSDDTSGFHDEAAAYGVVPTF